MMSFLIMGKTLTQYNRHKLYIINFMLEIKKSYDIGVIFKRSFLVYLVILL